MNTRTEKDTLGEVSVPADKWWGAQTQRSFQNFKIGTEKMPLEVVEAFTILKQATARANYGLGNLEEEKATIIEEVCEELRKERNWEHFPLVVWQTGSGTQSNMNMNEVVAYRANEKLAEQGSEVHIHPNDDVNRSQSSNDTFPTAMHIAAYKEISTLR